MIQTAAILLGLCFFALPSQAASISNRNSDKISVERVVVFGDSYSDNCQLWRLTSAPEVAAQYPFPSCPPAPTGRADGGFSWPEILRNGSSIDVDIYAVSAATCSNTYFNRTTAGATGTVSVPGVDEQIESFVSYQGNKVDYDSTVAVVFIGTNDVNFFTNELQYDPVTEQLAPGRTIVDEARCVTDRVNQLIEVGFTRIVLFNQIPLERTPYFSEDRFAGYGQFVVQNGTAVSIIAEQLVAANNALQRAYIPYQVKDAEKANIRFFDTHALFTDILDNPTSIYGANADVTKWCLVCETTASADDCVKCVNPDMFAWWDPLHPSQRSDEVIAQRFAQFLGLPYNWSQ